MFLLLEDDKTIASGIEYSLNQESYNVYIADTCKSATDYIKNNLAEIEFAILDLMLPDGNGYEICRLIKEKKDIPVIFLTACDEEVNVVMGLDMGADDYITKPFRVRELISRIKSVVRRYGKNTSLGNKVTIKDITIDFNCAKVYRAGVEIELTAMEYRLLLKLLNNRGHILSRNQLLEGIWDVSGDYVNDNTLTVYIKRLRGKLEHNNETIIETIRGKGYMIP